MAQIINTTIWNLPHSIERADAKPLDSTEIWLPTYDDNGVILTRAHERALAYAISDKTTSYVGQIICVVEGNKNHNYNGVEPKYYSIYLDSNGKGALLDLVPEIKIPEIPEVYSNRELNYKEGFKIIEDGYLLLFDNFKRTTSTLFINGVQYNNSEYEEGLYNISDSSFKSGGTITINDGTNDILCCNAIKFTKLELEAGDVFGDNRNNNGDEILISAAFVTQK